jgi:hypothetical protein
VTAGAAASTGLIDGFPLVWSQNIKDITLVHVGGSYSAIIDIAKKAVGGSRLQRSRCRRARTTRCSRAS